MADDKPHDLGTIAGGGHVFEHPLAAHLHEKPDQHKHLVTLTGYPGHSLNPKTHIRLYLHHDFQSYYEIKLTDIYHCWPSITKDSTEPVQVSIDAEAKPHLVVHTTLSSGAASFLRGHLVSSFLASAIESASTQPQLDLTGVPPPPPHGGIIAPILHRKHKDPKPPE